MVASLRGKRELLHEVEGEEKNKEMGERTEEKEELIILLIFFFFFFFSIDF